MSRPELMQLPVCNMPPGAAPGDSVKGIGIDAVLSERGTRYGEFTEHARICQSLKDALRDSPSWHKLRPAQREALEMIAHKLARIVNGDPDYDDSWRDVAGYARLVERDLPRR